jgi:predicted dehydrogenase
VPTDLHAEIAIAAAEAGKHVFCEKPIALDSGEARAHARRRRAAGVVHYLNHNYRRTPAVMLAKQLIDEGFVGRIFHWRGAYLQDWIVDPEFPLTWHLQREHAGAGPHFDLGSHNVDLARFLVGEIKSVSAMTARFVTERPLPGAGAATFSAGAAAAARPDPSPSRTPRS